MAKWSQSKIYEKTRGTNRWTRFVGWMNNLLNPEHDWIDDWQEYSNNTSPSEDIINQITKQDLTGAEKAANQFTADEAQKQRDWEMEMQNSAYQRQVADMRAAGVNPALAMSNGQPSTPSGASASSVAPSGSGMSMSDLMQMFMLPLTKKAAEANIEKTQADTERQRAETGLTAAKTENMALVNAYYPSVTEAGLDETLSKIGLNISTIDRNDMEAALTQVRTLIAEKENKYADEFYHWRSEYEKAHTQESKDSAAAHAAQALLTGYENQYAREHGARLSSSSIVALVSAIGSFLGLDDTAAQDGIQKVVKPLVEDSTKPFGMFKSANEEFKKLDIDGKLKRAVDKFERWRNKPKKVFRHRLPGNSR